MPAVEGHGGVEPEVGVGFCVEGDDFADGGIGLDPEIVALVDQEMEAVSGDGEVAGEEGGGVEGIEFAGETEGDGVGAIGLGQGKSGGVVPPLVHGFAQWGRVEGHYRLAEQSGAEGAAGEAGAVDSEAAFAAPDVAGVFERSEGGQVT